MEMIGQLFWPSAVHLGVEWKHQAIALIRLVGKMFISQLTCHFHRETAISRPSENRGTTENVTWRPTLSLFRSPFCTCPILLLCCMSLCVCVCVSECEWVSMNECEGEFGCLWWECAISSLDECVCTQCPKIESFAIYSIRRHLSICRFSVAQWALTLYYVSMKWMWWAHSRGGSVMEYI